MLDSNYIIERWLYVIDVEQIVGVMNNSVTRWDKTMAFVT